MTQTNTDNWNGSKYKENSSLQYNAAMKFLREQIFQGNENILDVGCGDGKITYEIASHFTTGQVLGIDASSNMLQEAIQNFHRINLNFQKNDAQHLDFDSQFDVVTSFFCLQWVADKLAALKGIVRGLKPKGRFIAIIPMIGRLPEITNELMQTKYWQKYFLNFGDPIITARDTQYDSYAKKAGLIFVKYEIEHITSHFSSKNEMCNWLFAVTPHLTRLPTQEEKQQFIEDAVDIHLQEFPANNDGSCNAKFSLIKIIGALQDSTDS